jgi:fumarylacetoacetate (FAA) hydrolase
MKLATLRDGTRDGQPAVVRRDNQTCVPIEFVDSMQDLLDHWSDVEPALRAKSEKLNDGDIDGRPVDVEQLDAPVPRAHEWIDGSAYLNHIVLVRRARGAEPPENMETDPLVYQGGSGDLLAPTDDIPLPDVEWGLDFEAEVAVVLGDTPRGTSADDADDRVELVTLANDITFRNLIPNEISKSFGFLQSKPATAFAPFAVTPDELGDAWKSGRVHHRLRTTYNGELFGDPEAGPEMHFSFHDLIEHIAKTRNYTAGTILGSGTVSNEDRDRGSSCLAEQRKIETIEYDEVRTEYMREGDTVQIEMRDDDGHNIFGTIDQEVVSV